METCSKCQCCWKGGPPYLWFRASAPQIPQTKDLLIEALKGSVEEAYCRKLPRDELKDMYRKHVRGEPHPADPTQGMASLQKERLAQRLEAHGLAVGNEHRGAMMSLLRGHWSQQCKLANSDLPTPGPPQSEGDTSWHLIHSEEEGTQQHLVQEFRDASETLELALNAICDASKQKHLAEKVRAAHRILVEASYDLLESLD